MKCNECNYKEQLNSTTLKCTITTEEHEPEFECNIESTRVCRDNRAKVDAALADAEEARTALRNRAGVVMVPREDFVSIYNALRNVAFTVESDILDTVVERLGKML